jgi:hypothetical protein
MMATTTPTSSRWGLEEGEGVVSRPSSEANCYSRAVPKTSSLAATTQPADPTLINEFIETEMEESGRRRRHCRLPF